MDKVQLELEFSINSNAIFDMELLESSFDLMTNPLFNIQKRENWMMPTPFVLNDAVLIKEKIKPSPVIVNPTVLIPAITIPVVKRKIPAVTDSLKVE